MSFLNGGLKMKIKAKHITPENFTKFGKWSLRQ
jgi:hypothetical protein